MKENSSTPTSASELRRMAEQRLQEQKTQQPLPGIEQDTERLLHELQVHQIELEMQNETLRQVQLTLEESRDRYVDLYEFAPVGYLTLTDAGLIAEVNLTCADLLRKDRRALLQRLFTGFVAPKDTERWHRHFLHALRHGEKQTCEIDLKRNDGTVFPTCLDFRLAATRDAAPTIRITLTDITARKEAEAELLAAKAEAEKANSDKSRFLAAASHDLRQPLLALSLYVGLLKYGVAEGGGELAPKIEECVASLNEMLTDLLDISKLDAGVVKPKLVDIDVDELLAGIASVHSAEADLKRLSLRVHYCGAVARTDFSLLRRIVGNLVANAVRYTEKGGVMIACRRHHGKRWVEVWDTGIGIPEDKTGVIFEEFRQLGDDARSRGSGLGLSIVAKAAALLGLQIRVRSRPGRGSMFAVELPPGRRIDIQKLPTIRPGARPLRIGLVEDNRMALDALVLALEDSGHEVIAARTGKALLETLDQGIPDIVISDYRLAAGETGFDAIAAARNVFGADLPAILITGDTEPAVVRIMADRGIALLYKPLKIDTLLVCIDEVTERRSS